MFMCATVDSVKIPALLDLVNVLTTLMAPLDTADSDQLLETPLNRQTALYSLKLLARMLGCQQQQQFLPVATACFQIISDKTETYEVSLWNVNSTSMYLGVKDLVRTSTVKIVHFVLARSFPVLCSVLHSTVLFWVLILYHIFHDLYLPCSIACWMLGTLTSQGHFLFCIVSSHLVVCVW